ncbi:ectonucleoside triphosphate diphosphohydrolase 8-like isoform X2 [Thrips palmi]|nr:ectonucleoside triphosphate diphosphohydrolase 8-like isoform X2 [Thrips palmi]
MEVEQRHFKNAEAAGKFTESSDNQPPSLSSSVHTLDLGVSSSVNLTFTNSKIRSDEEHIRALKGLRNCVLLAVLLLVLSLAIIGAVILAIFWISNQEAPFDYAMIFDAGSTHTEMVIYKWQADKFNGTGVVSQVASCDMKGGIGVVLREDPAATAPGYLGPCVAQGLAAIPEARRGHSPVYLAATAGMRLVRSESTSDARRILASVERTLERAAAGEGGMLIGVNGVRIISGQEEAVAGWISANYLLRTIYPKPARMVGMLDMGGASTQITFVHQEDPTSLGAFSATEHDTTLRLYGATHELYARSYMCFGQGQLLNRYLVLLVKDLLESTQSLVLPDLIQVKSPCHHLDYKETMMFRDFVNVCSETLFTSELKNITVNLEGSSNSSECKVKIKELLDTNHCLNTFTSKDCFSKPATHPPDTIFVAVSGFHYVMDYLGFSNKEHPAPDNFSRDVDKWCSMTWEDLKVSHPGIREEYLSLVCFNAQYQAHLLFDGYGIKEDTWKNIDFLKKINGTSVGWTLGFTIRSTNAFPQEQASAPSQTIAFLSSIFVLAVCIGVCLTLIFSILAKNHCRSNQISIK